MLFERFKILIEEKKLIEPNSTVLVAVSGGVDSVVLLHLLSQMRTEKKLKLVIAHLNHGIRGDEADADEHFVRQVAKQYSYQHFSKKVNTPHYAKKFKMSLETAARELRYDFLKKTAEKVGANLIALGHNANDQAETILAHFIRGAGLAGLAGMRMKKDIFVRPLLNFKRYEIENYAVQASLNFREDSSNRDVAYQRNRLRYQLIPTLEKDYNPQLVDALLRAAETFEENDQFLRTLATELYQKMSTKNNDKIVLDIRLFLKYLSIIQKYVIFEAVENIGLSRTSLSSARISRIIQLAQRGRSGTRASLSGNWEVVVNGTFLVFMSKDLPTFKILLSKGEEYFETNRGWIFRSTLVSREEMVANLGKDRAVEFVDADKIPDKLQLRTWQTGDRFIPFGLKGKKKVSDYFIDEKIPNHLRRSIPILTCEKGIIWICGYRLSETFRVQKSTSSVLKLEYREDHG